MGTAIETCCGEREKNLMIMKKKSLSIRSKNEELKYEDEIETKEDKISTKELWEQKNGQLTLSDECILRLLGKLIKIDKQATIDDFQIQGIAGAGSFGIVYVAQLKSNQSNGVTQKYAIKRLIKDTLVKKNLISNVIDERDILSMGNRFLVQLIMAFQDPWYLYLVMQYAPCGDTYDLFREGSFKANSYKKLGQQVIKFISGCVILGLEFLHKNNYMYRDLKPQNVLVFGNGYVKITDFGLVKKSFKGQKSLTISGTSFYYAPQMVLNRGYDKAIDLWGLGIYLYELSNYQPPFTEEQITKANFEAACIKAQQNRVWINHDISPQLKDIIDKLLQLDTENRLGVKGGWEQVKNHSFFQDFNWKTLEEGEMASPLSKIAEMFPPSMKPFKPEPPVVQTTHVKVQGWSMVKKKNTM